MPATTEVARFILAGKLAQKYDVDPDDMRGGVDGLDAWFETDRATFVAALPNAAKNAFGDMAEAENHDGVDQFVDEVFDLIHKIAKRLDLNWDKATDTVKAAVTHYDDERTNMKSALTTAVTGPLNGRDQLQVSKRVTDIRAQ